MAHHNSHRRIVAAPDPQTPMDPTSRKPKPNPSATAAAKTHRHPQPLIHPLPDPTVTPPSTIQNISHRFSRLYVNHKKLVANSLKPHPHPQPDTHFQEKFLSFSPVLDTSCTTLTKSSSQHERNGSSINSVVAKVVEKNHYLSTKKSSFVEKDDFKKPSSKKGPKKSSSEECDVKKESQLMSKGMVNEELKVFQEGFEMRGRNSISSIPPAVNGGRRRSFCSSQVELADFFSCTGVKVVAVDMPPFMQIHAVDCARKAHDSLEKFTSKTLAFTLKKEFDGVYGPAWHCIVGTSFGSFVTHSVGGFMYFSMDHKLYVLLFKTTVQRAE